MLQSTLWTGDAVTASTNELVEEKRTRAHAVRAAAVRREEPPFPVPETAMPRFFLLGKGGMVMDEVFLSACPGKASVSSAVANLGND